MDNYKSLKPKNWQSISDLDAQLKSWYDKNCAKKEKLGLGIISIDDLQARPNGMYIKKDISFVVMNDKYYKRK